MIIAIFFLNDLFLLKSLFPIIINNFGKLQSKAPVIYEVYH